MARLLITERGEPVQLDEQSRNRLGVGGQGKVFSASLGGELVAVKLLHHPEAQRLRDLQALDPACGAVATLPIRLLLDGSNGSGRLVGYAMRRLDPATSLQAARLFNFQEISRLAAFTWLDAIGAAIALAEAVANLHRHGVVIGDLNSENVLFQRDNGWRALVIDTDSFQLQGSSGQRHHCPVARAPYSAPELIGADLGRIWRHPSSDDFALAVLIHQLLLHDHPYDNAINQAEPELPTASRIARGLYPHGAIPRPGLSASPCRPSPAQISPAIERAFRRSFHATQAEPLTGLRPTASAWAALLRELQGEVVPCSRSRHHHHPRGRDCLWCTVDRAAGATISLFSPDSPPAAATAARQAAGDGSLPPLPDALRPLVQKLQAHQQRSSRLRSLQASLIDRLLDRLGSVAALQAAHGRPETLLDQAALQRRIETRNGWWRRWLAYEGRQPQRQVLLDQLVQLCEALAQGVRSSLYQLTGQQKTLLHEISGYELSPIDLAPDQDPEALIRRAIATQRERLLSERLARTPLRSWTVDGFGEGRWTLLESHGLHNAEQLRRGIGQITALPGIGNGLAGRLRTRLQHAIELERKRLEGQKVPIPAESLPQLPRADTSLERLERKLQGM